MEDNDDLQMSPLRVAAAQLHELYNELREAGFSKSEALILVSRTMAYGANEQSEE